MACVLAYPTTITRTRGTRRRAARNEKNIDGPAHTKSLSNWYRWDVVNRYSRFLPKRIFPEWYVSKIHSRLSLLGVEGARNRQDSIWRIKFGRLVKVLHIKHLKYFLEFWFIPSSAIKFRKTKPFHFNCRSPHLMSPPSVPFKMKKICLYFSIYDYTQ